VSAVRKTTTTIAATTTESDEEDEMSSKTMLLNTQLRDEEAKAKQWEIPVLGVESER
jgi:hypothetical protein